MPSSLTQSESQLLGLGAPEGSAKLRPASTTRTEDRSRVCWWQSSSSAATYGRTETPSFLTARVREAAWTFVAGACAAGRGDTGGDGRAAAAGGEGEGGEGAVAVAAAVRGEGGATSAWRGLRGVCGFAADVSCCCALVALAFLCLRVILGPSTLRCVDDDGCTSFDGKGEARDQLLVNQRPPQLGVQKIHDLVVLLLLGRGVRGEESHKKR